MLSRIGLKPKISIIPHTEYLASTAVGKYEGIGLPNIAAQSVNQLMAAHLVGSTKNVSHIDDPKVTDFVWKQWGLADRAERKKVLDEFQIYMASQAYRVVYPLGYDFVGWHPWLKNYRPHGTAEYGGFRHTLERAWLDKG